MCIFNTLVDELDYECLSWYVDNDKIVTKKDNTSLNVEKRKERLSINVVALHGRRVGINNNPTFHAWNWALHEFMTWNVVNEHNDGNK